MALTPQQILDRLIAILPGFRAYWESGAACSRDDDGSFTRCGVFSDCSHFIRDRYEQLSPLQRRQLADFVVECMSSTDRELCDAGATCFLENLTFERFSRDFESYLAGDALDFYRRFQGA
jgi:hypothetical protein